MPKIVLYSCAQMHVPKVGVAYDLDKVSSYKLARDLTADTRQWDSIQILIDAFRPTCKTLVIEFDYFDIDYRSEFSSSHEYSFVVRDPSTQRLHFFAESVAEDEISLVRLVRRIEQSYRGYAILRPQFPGTIGRSLISPSGTSSHPAGTEDDADTPELIHGLTLEQRVRTAVPETVELFGTLLRAVGVPYMEQDGHLLRCAHVSAWICHYTAVLRGRVPRRVSAAFHYAEDETGSYGRQYPSSGMTRNVLVRVLRKLDLPPEVIDMFSLAGPLGVASDIQRASAWYHRTAFRSQVTRDEVTGEEPSRAQVQRAWLAHNFTSTICRYLNSGIPVILANEAQDHTVVVCGYIRNRRKVKDEVGVEGSLACDEEGSASVKNNAVVSEDAKPVTGGVEALILQDDTENPYTIMSVDSIMDWVIGDGEKIGRKLALVVPLPRGLWLSGAVAEEQGAALFSVQIAEAAGTLDAWLTEGPGKDLGPDLAKTYRETYEELREGIQDNRDDFAVRSYVLSGSEFKASVGERIKDEVVSEVLGCTRLPKFVWIIELIKRKLRTADDESKCVIATVVLDASLVSDGPDVDLQADSLFFHLPGQVLSYLSGQPEWLPAETIEPYRTGRWNHKDPWSGNDGLYYQSYKGAQVR